MSPSDHAESAAAPGARGPVGASRPRVAALGDLNLDLTLEVPGHPPAGGEAFATAQHSGVGGSATNTAIVLARAGVHCRLLACVGDDPWGHHLLGLLSAAGTDAPDVAAVQRHASEPTQVNVVAVTPDGERTMYAYRGANTRLAPTQQLLEVVGDSEVLHLSAYALLAAPQRDTAQAAVAAASSAGRPVVADVPVGPALEVPEHLRAVLPSVHTLVASAAEAQAITATADAGNAVGRLLELGVRRVALKLGREGCRLVRSDGEVAVPAATVEPLDTTGAGDSFAAGVVLGLAHGWDDQATGELAAALGGLAVTRRGAGLALASRREIADLVARLERS